MNFLAIYSILFSLALVDWTTAQNLQAHPCANRYNVFVADPGFHQRFYWCSASSVIVSYCSQDRRFVESLQYCVPIDPPSTSTQSNNVTSSKLPTTTSRGRTPSRQTRTLPSRAPRTTRATSTTQQSAAALNAPVTQRPRPTRRVTVRN